MSAHCEMTAAKFHLKARLCVSPSPCGGGSGSGMNVSHCTPVSWRCSALLLSMLVRGCSAALWLLLTLAAMPSEAHLLGKCLARGAGELAEPASDAWKKAVRLQNSWFDTQSLSEPPAAVVLPSTAQEVSHVIMCAREHGVRVTARCGSHGNAGAAGVGGHQTPPPPAAARSRACHARPPTRPSCTVPFRQKTASQTPCCCLAGRRGRAARRRHPGPAPHGHGAGVRRRLPRLHWRRRAPGPRLPRDRHRHQRHQGLQWRLMVRPGWLPHGRTRGAAEWRGPPAAHMGTCMCRRADRRVACLPLCCAAPQ